MQAPSLLRISVPGPGIEDTQRLGHSAFLVVDTRPSLFLDDPKAALDPLAERCLFERFTALVISQRVGPARLADRIIVMDNGRIVESGHHDALIARGGRYARMYTSQAEWYNDERHSAVPIA